MSILLETKNIHKSFGENTILRDISFTLEHGLKYGLYGPNGAGKSTLIKILSGETKLTKGSIYFARKLFTPTTIKSSLKKNIAIIYQDTPLVYSLSIIENVFLGKERKQHPPCNHFGDVFSLFLEKIDASKDVNEITNEEKFFILICKALLWEPKLLIFDEATNLLSQSTREWVFSQLNVLFASGTTLLMVSHDLSEMTSLCDKIFGIYRGHICDPISRSNNELFDSNKISNLQYDCFGSSDKITFKKIPLRGKKEAIIKWKYIDYPHHKKTLTLSLHKGELLCIHSNYNVHDFLKSLFSSTNGKKSNISILGRTYNSWSPTIFRQNGISLFYDDPVLTGFPDLSLDKNLIVTKNTKTFPFGFLNRFKIQNILQDATFHMDISPKSPKTLYSDFSGGNKQKINIARDLFHKDTSNTIIAYNITKGLDHKSKFKLLEKIQEYSNHRTSILFISDNKNECESLLGNVKWSQNGPIELLTNT